MAERRSQRRAGPRRRRSRWLIAAAAIAALISVTALVAAIVAFTWFDVSLNDGVGDRAYAPVSTAELRSPYKLGVGSLRLDLSRVPAGKTLRVEAHVGIGELRVVVPRGASVAVDARVKAGSASVLGRHDDGRDVHVSVSGGGNLQLEARVGAGAIDVERGG